MGKFLIHVIFSSNFGKPARFEEIMGKISAVFLLKTNKIKLLMVIINFHNSFFSKLPYLWWAASISKNSPTRGCCSLERRSSFFSMMVDNCVEMWSSCWHLFPTQSQTIYLLIFPMMWDMSDSKEKQKKMNFWCSRINIEQSTYFSRNTIIQTHQVCLHGWCL